MKKRQKTTLTISSIALAIIIVALLIILFLPKSGAPRSGDLKNVGDYYTFSYDSSYNSDNQLFDNDIEYEIVDNIFRLNTILDKFDGRNVADFDENFFNSNNLLIANGGVGAEIEALEFDESSAKITIYYDCPFGTMDDVYTFNAFLIPVNKAITGASITSSCYPGRDY